MSVENLKKFAQMCIEDEAVKAKAKEIGLNDPEGLIKYAGKDLDLEFTTDDMKKLAEEAGSSQDELNEDDLEKIAGGVVTTTGVLIASAAVGAACAVTSTTSSDGW